MSAKPSTRVRSSAWVGEPDKSGAIAEATGAVGGGRVFSYVDNRQNQVTHEIVAERIVEADAVYDEDTATKVVKMPGIGCCVLHEFTFDPLQQTRRRVGGVDFCDVEMEPRSSPTSEN